MASYNTTAPKLSNDTASKLLANVFNACEQEPNTIPLDKLASYSEYRRERYSLQKTVTLIVLVVFLLLPLCFIVPKFDVVSVTESAAGYPVYEIQVKGEMPVSLVAASIESHSFPVYETGDRMYSVEPTIDGPLKVKVSLLNRQYTVKEYVVSGIDVDVPVLQDISKADGFLYLTVTDGDGLGVDYSSIKADLTSSGGTIYPISFDESTGLVVFDYPFESMQVSVPDKKGNTLQLVITVS